MADSGASLHPAVVSASEANRSFSTLLRQVAQGQRFTVLSHGRPVATIAPAAESTASLGVSRRARHQPAGLCRRLRGRSQDAGGSGAPAWRALDPWEAENALWALRRYVLPLEPLSCPVNQAFLNSISWPLHAAYREARRVGDATTMLRMRLEVQRERMAWALARS